MKATITFLFALSALATGLVAASYWYRSTFIPIEQTNKEAKSVEFATLGLLKGTIEAYQKVAALNNKAALWTASTALLSAASAVAGAWLTSN